MDSTESLNMIIAFATDVGDMWRETQGAIQCDSKEFDVIRKRNE